MIDFKTRNFDVVTVTPELARKILDEHNNYRKVNKRRVSAYTRIMNNNEWELAQPIIFDDDGILIDGQHRLQAIISCGRPQQFVFIAGLPRRAMSAIDSGQARTSEQVLSFERRDAQGKLSPSIIRAILTMPSTHCDLIQNSEFPSLYDALEDYLIVLKQLFPKKEKGFCRAPFQAAVVRCLMNYEDSIEVVTTLCDEMNTAKFKRSKNGGILSRMLITEPYGGATSNSIVYMKSARALKAEISGVELNKLYVPSQDPLPLPAKYKCLI